MFRLIAMNCRPYFLPICVLGLVIMLRDSVNATKNYDDEFQSRIASSISLAPPDFNWEKKEIEHLNSEERRALCISAQRNASLPLTNKDQHIFKAQLYQVKFSKKSDEMMVVAINCQSYPSMYLGYFVDGRPWILYNSEIRWLIFVEDSRYTFHVETVTDVTRAPDLYLTSEESDYFNRLDREDRWNLCLSAKNRIQQITVEFNSTSRIPNIEPRYYFVDNRPIEKYATALIMCPLPPLKCFYDLKVQWLT